MCIDTEDQPNSVAMGRHPELLYQWPYTDTPKNHALCHAFTTIGTSIPFNRRDIETVPVRNKGHKGLFAMVHALKSAVPEIGCT